MAIPARSGFPLRLSGIAPIPMGRSMTTFTCVPSAQMNTPDGYRGWCSKLLAWRTLQFMSSLPQCHNRHLRFAPTIEPDMKTLFRILTLATCLNSAPAAIIYDSGGFETFIPNQNLDGQDAGPLGHGPWAQDNGTSTNVVTAVNPIEGNQSVKITRAPGAGNTRWGLVKPIIPAGLNNLVNIYFDMFVVRQTNDFGPA